MSNAAFNPSDSARVLLVDPAGLPYVLAGIAMAGAFNPSDSARVVLVDEDGVPYKASGGGAGIDLDLVITGVGTLTFTGGNLTAFTPA